MDKLSYRRHRFPSIVIQQAVWLYFRFALSYRDVEDMLAERGIDVSYETVRRWALKFGAIIARKLRRGRARSDGRWHLDAEMYWALALGEEPERVQPAGVFGRPPRGRDFQRQ
jgi:transposase-like protein